MGPLEIHICHDVGYSWRQNLWEIEYHTDLESDMVLATSITPQKKLGEYPRQAYVQRSCETQLSGVRI